MIEISGLHAGNPWHGIYSASTNSVALPNGQAMAWPAGAEHPTMSLIGSHAAGDVFMVKVPEQAEVVTSVSDIAAGKKWLNYGIVSGQNHSFYGVELGIDRWLYVAADKSVWLAQLDYDLVTDSGAVRFTRFGIVGIEVAGIIQSIPVSGLFGAAGEASWMIDDIKPGCGERVLFSAYDDVTRNNGSWPLYRSLRRFVSGREIIISGVPPAASITYGLTVLPGDGIGHARGERVVSSSAFSRYWWPPGSGGGTPTFIDSSDLLSGTPAPLSGTYSASNDAIVVGLCFDSEGVAVPVNVSMTLSLATTGDGGGMALADGEWDVFYAATTSTTSTLAVSVGSQSITLSGDGVQDVTKLAGSEPTSVISGAYRGVTGAFAGSIDFIGYEGDVGAGLMIVIKRFAAGVYGVFEIPATPTPQAPFDSHTRLIGIVSAHAADASIVDLGDAGITPWQRWATKHPVSHSITVATAAICHV